MSIIHDIMQSVLTAVNLLLGVISLLLRISYALGQIIVISVLYCFDIAQTCIQKMQLVSFILYRDFCVFLSDLHGYLTFFYSFFHQFGTDVFSLALSSWNEGKRFILNSASLVASAAICVSENIVKIFELLSAVPEVIKQFIIVVGSGIWLAFKLIPLTIVYVGSLFVYFIGRSFEEVADIFHSIVKILYATYCRLFRFINEIPQEAYFGIALGFMMLLMCVKYHSHITYYGVHIITCLHIYFVNLMWHTWSKLKELFIHTLRVVWSRDIQVYLENDNVNDNVEENVDEVIEQSVETARNSRSFKISEHSYRRNKMSFSQGENDEALCVVCMDATKKVVIMPCRHLCICRDCCISVKRELGKCPVCRGVIRSAVEVYS